MFLAFLERRPSILWSVTSLRQFNWERSRNSSRELELDPCQGFEDLLPSNGYPLLASERVVLMSGERRDDGPSLTTD